MKIGSTFSDGTNILKGILKGAILGPLFFNISINDFSFSQQSLKYSLMLDKICKT